MKTYDEAISSAGKPAPSGTVSGESMEAVSLRLRIRAIGYILF